jgi:hypothetical protein
LLFARSQAHDLLCTGDLYSVGFKCQFAQAQALYANEQVKVMRKMPMADRAVARRNCGF